MAECAVDDPESKSKQASGQQPTFAELMVSTKASVIRFEMRDAYDHTVKGFAEWQATVLAGTVLCAARPARTISELASIWGVVGGGFGKGS